VLVEVAGCGVCRTDLHLARGEISRVDLPITLGHEVAGHVSASGRDAGKELEAAGLREGDPVLVHGGWGCGACAECRAGQEQRCPDGISPGFQADGGYAEAMLVPHARHLVALGDLHPVHAAPLADAGVTTLRAVHRADRWLQPSARVLVIGLGGLGQFAIQHLRRLPGLRIAVQERNPAKVQRATELGADGALLDGDASAVRDALGGPADVVFDLVGADVTLQLASQVVGQDGLVMLVGEAGGSVRFGFSSVPVESWLTTTAWGSLEDLREVVRLVQEGALSWDVESLPLASANAALERVAAGEVTGRLVLVPARTTQVAPETGRE
jgi:propanol-preferring alcohol dehydrogenase